MNKLIWLLLAFSIITLGGCREAEPEPTGLRHIRLPMGYIALSLIHI